MSISYKITTIREQESSESSMGFERPTTVSYAAKSLCLPELLFNMYIHKEQICNYLFSFGLSTKRLLLFYYPLGWIFCCLILSLLLCICLLSGLLKASSSLACLSGSSLCLSIEFLGTQLISGILSPIIKLASEKIVDSLAISQLLASTNESQVYGLMFLRFSLNSSWHCFLNSLLLNKESMGLPPSCQHLIPWAKLEKKKVYYYIKTDYKT